MCMGCLCLEECQTIVPSDMSKSFVYRKYVESSELVGEHYLSCRKFEDLWKDLQPSVLTNKPATDLCFTQQNNGKLAKALQSMSPFWTQEDMPK